MDIFSDWLITEMPMQMGGDVGLIVNEQSDPTFFVLIKNSPKLQSALRRSDVEELENSIYGVMSTRQNDKYNAVEVDKVWARQGYGPLLYYIAMSESGSRGLMATRVSNEVSAEAKSVWANFNSGVGKGSVRAIPLDAEGYNHHPEDYLMNKYVMINPMDLSALSKRGKAIIGRDPHGEKLVELLEAAESILGQEMNKIYRPDL